MLVERPRDWFNMTCPICGIKFHLKPCAVKRFKTHYCSKECFRIAKIDIMKGEKNHQYGLKGSKNASWKTDIKLSAGGYIMIRRYGHPFADKHGWVLKHRLIAEEFLLNDENSIEIGGKKYLKREYDVHHKNFDIYNNNPENLVVMTRKEHTVLHNRLSNKFKERDECGRFKKNMDVVKIKRVTETAVIPEKKSIGAAGYDLSVDSDKEIVVKPHETVMVRSGLAFSIPKNYVGLIYARSGLSVKMGIRPATCVSVIDSDYRGEVGLPLHNDSNSEVTILPYERVGQIIFQQCIPVTIEQVDSLDDTERGENGFGSTGR